MEPFELKVHAASTVAVTSTVAFPAACTAPAEPNMTAPTATITSVLNLFMAPSSSPSAYGVCTMPTPITSTSQYIDRSSEKQQHYHVPNTGQPKSHKLRI